MISESSVEWEVLWRGWRSSRLATGASANGRMIPSDSARSSARSSESSAARMSPSASRASGVEHGRLGDRRRPVKRRGGAFDHRRQDVDGLLGILLREADDRFGDTHVGGVALLSASVR